MILIIAAGIILAFCIMRITASLLPIVLLVFGAIWIAMWLGIPSPFVPVPQPTRTEIPAPKPEAAQPANTATTAPYAALAVQPQPQAARDADVALRAMVARQKLTPHH
jgi:hypothetical protein